MIKKFLLINWLGFGIWTFGISAAKAAVLVGPGGTADTFLKIPISARADGMAGAFTGVSGDAAALEYNPAGLAGIDRIDLNATLIRYLVDADLQSLAIGFPVDLKKGPNLGEGFFGPDSDKIFIGLQYRAFKAKDTAYDTNGTPLHDFNITSELFHAGVGYSPFERLSLGVSAKYVKDKLDTTTASNFASDAGAIWRLTGQTSLGVSLLNMGQGKKFQSGTDPLDTMLRTGLAYQGRYVLLTGDVSQGRDKITQLATGAEVAVSRYLRLRGGVVHHTDFEVAGGIGVLFTPPARSASDREKQANKNVLEDLDVSRNSPVFAANASDKPSPVDFGLDYALRTHTGFDVTHTITLRVLY